MINRISDVAYELYRQNWIDTNVTREMRLNDIRNWGKTEIENDDEDLACSYEEYVAEFGIGNGSLYACYNEFIDYEYQDREFMKALLKSDALIEAYLKDEEKLLNDESRNKRMFI